MTFVLGEEFLINAAAPGAQGSPRIASLADGRIVVGYETAGTGSADSDPNGVSARIFTATGQNASSELLLNTWRAEVQSQVSVAPLKTGGFVATWVTADAAADGSGSAIKAQIYDANGARSGQEFRVNSFATDWQLAPHVTGLSGGNFVVTWVDNTFPSNNRGQIFTAAGQPVGGELVLNAPTGGGWSPEIAALPGGGFLAAWEVQTNIQTSLVAQRFDAGGAKIGAAIPVSTTPGSEVGAVALSTFADGGFVAVWSVNQYGRQDIKAQLFDANGTKSGAEFRMNDPDSTYNAMPDVAVLADGSFVAAWQRTTSHVDSRGFIVSDGYGVVAQQFARSGTALGREVQIDGGGNNRYTGPSITATAAGGYAVAWTDGTSTSGENADLGAKVRIFGPNSAPVITSGNGATAAVSVAENSTAVTTVTASDLDVNAKLRFSIIGGADASFFRIDPVSGALAFVYAPDFEATSFHANRYDITVQVSDGYDVDTQAIRVEVTDVVETRGTAGNDTLVGTIASDEIVGLAGNDVLVAYGGHDTLMGGSGNDILDGTGGIATASYADAEAGVRVSLAIGKLQSTGGGGKDTLLSIEHLIGSNFADRLTGDAGDNHIMGGGGADVIDGAAGADTMEGGTGNDTYLVDNVGDLVIEQPDEGLVDVVQASISYVLPDNVERLVLTGSANLTGRGNALANSLTGNDGDNWLSGGSGPDTLSGGAGNDTLIGGMQSDRLVGGAGSDLFVFDALTTSADKDTISDFTSGVDRLALSTAVFSALAGAPLGALPAEDFVVGKKALNPDQHIIYNSATGALYYDQDGSGVQAAVMLAVLSTKPVLTAGDIVLI